MNFRLKLTGYSLVEAINRRAPLPVVEEGRPSPDVDYYSMMESKEPSKREHLFRKKNEGTPVGRVSMITIFGRRARTRSPTGSTLPTGNLRNLPGSGRKNVTETNAKLRRPWTESSSQWPR